MGERIISFLDTEGLYCEENKSWREILFHKASQQSLLLCCPVLGFIFSKIHSIAVVVYILRRCQIGEIMPSHKLGLAHLFPFSS